MAISRKEYKCSKCRKKFILATTEKIICPFCAKEALIPKGTIAIMQMTIQPGGYNDDNLCLEDGLATKAQSGGIYLRGWITVLSKPYLNKKFSTAIWILRDDKDNNKREYLQGQGRKLIRGILNSSQGLSPSDNSRKAVYGRIMPGYKALDGIAFIGVVDIYENAQGKKQNTVLKALEGDNKDYKKWLDNKLFSPARKFPPRTEPGSAMWLRS